MSVYVIADLHLSQSTQKPMDIFGAKWENHTQKIYENWQGTVTENDTVIIPGDISWGMDFDTTASDLRFVDGLNGKKLIGKGNHDYWWQTMKKLKNYINENGIKTVDFLFNNAYEVENYIICGTRGWMFGENMVEEDLLVYNREIGRLKLSLDEGKKLQSKTNKEIIVFMHYPPSFNGNQSRELAEIFEKYGIKRCYYGHLHGVREDLLDAFCGNTRIYCISADYISFKPMIII